MLKVVHGCVPVSDLFPAVRTLPFLDVEHVKGYSIECAWSKLLFFALAREKVNFRSSSCLSCAVFIVNQGLFLQRQLKCR